MRFGNGLPVKVVDSATYLGCLLTPEIDINKEVPGKIVAAAMVWRRMREFWLRGNCTTEQKLHVYDAVIRSKFLYAMNTVELNDSHIQRLEPFQLKGLRQILGFTTTYVNRSNTNAKVLDAANLYANAGTPEEKHKIRVTTFGAYCRAPKLRYLGHLLRTDDFCPERTVIFHPYSANPIVLVKGERRFGRPRKNWVEQAMNQAWEVTRRLYNLSDQPVEYDRKAPTVRTMNEFILLAAWFREF